MPAPAPAPQPTIAPPSNDAAAAPPVTLSLASDEIAMLLKRGKDAFSTGDLAAARLLLRRAAEAGSAEAALALGATFDPLVIRRLGAIGAAPDRRAGAAMVPKGRRARLDYGIAAVVPA